MAFALASNTKHYKSRNDAIDLIVLHVTAGLQDLDLLGEDHSARKTNQYGATTSRSASWHSCVDSDSIDPALPDEFTAWHCKGYNSESLGIEICNKDARWDNKPQDWVRATLLNAAKVCHEWERKHNIPRRLLTKKQVDAGERGYSYHMFLDPDRRSDPGRTFPWAYFVELLESLDAGTAAPKPVESDTEKPVAPAKSVNQLADEVIAGKHGSGDARKRALGGQYDEVQRLVNQKLSGKKPSPPKPAQKSTDQLAREVIDGKHGSGDARKRALGGRYRAVQDRVNQILKGGSSAPSRSSGPTLDQLIRDTMAGKYGNGEDRKRRLGVNYGSVQKAINRRLG